MKVVLHMSVIVAKCRHVFCLSILLINDKLALQYSKASNCVIYDPLQIDLYCLINISQKLKYVLQYPCGMIYIEATKYCNVKGASKNG